MERLLVIASFPIRFAHEVRHDGTHHGTCISTTPFPVVVERCCRKPGRRRNVRDPEFVDLVARTNVSMAVKQIQEQSPVLQELEKKGAIKIVGCMYDLGTARIALL